MNDRKNLTVSVQTCLIYEKIDELNFDGSDEGRPMVQKDLTSQG
ncbi:MAG: hypothetical protein RBS33_03990 [Lentimicrobium sp.]|jgi:hypothetical protein|nr:hypothetical protein [Lentimicrobiaceae bacterium]MDY0025125.1 hypothetical protein [Lentimicrobium sp.]